MVESREIGSLVAAKGEEMSEVAVYLFERAVAFVVSFGVEVVVIRDGSQC